MAAPMDHSQCHVVYFDERAGFDRWVKKDGTASSVANPPTTTSSYFDINAGEPDDLQANILIIRAVFNQGESSYSVSMHTYWRDSFKACADTLSRAVYVCNTSGAFISKVSELQQSVGLDCTPILGFISTDHAEFSKPSIARGGLSNYSRDTMSPSPTSFRRTLTREFSSSPEPEELHGLRLIARVHSDIESESGPKVTIPVAVLRFDTSESTPTASHGPGPSHTSVPDESGQFSSPSDQPPSTKIEPHTMRKCLDAGAIDVLSSPLDESRVFGLTSHAYRVHKDAHKAQSAIMARTRNRKRSWVGVNEEKPYAYLRESMVSKLMAGICNPDEDELTFHVQ
jgi:3',5'-cyclic-nucleotide phosphodiesterase